MKTLLRITMPLLAVMLMAFTYKYVKEISTPIKVEHKTLPVLVPVKITAEIPTIKLYNHQDFLDDLGWYESSNRYNITNRWGYMGRYQFHISTLQSLGINTTKKEFLSNPDLQEEAMDRLLKNNYRTLRRFIRKYEGTKRHGVLVTKSGVLAAAHLGGAGNVINWFRKGDNFADGNGTKITTYMEVFGGYSLNL